MTLKKALMSLALLLIGILKLQAQDAVPATGGDAIGSGGSASYTVGQVAYTSHSGINGTVSQGVQQAYEIMTSLGEDLAGINLELAAYPNPTVNHLNLSIENFNHENLSYQLVDLQGKQLAQKTLNKSKSKIDMQELPVGTYLLSVFQNNSLIKTFRIVKN